MNTSYGAPLLALTIEGEPPTKARPRVANGRAYTPAATRDAEAVIGLLARAALRSRPPASALLHVELVFVSATRRRRDLDNMAKLVLDALNGVAYVDDAQIARLLLTKSVDPARPRTEIAIFEAPPDV